MTTAILDLDYTLLDTASFKEALVSALVDCGVSRKRLDETYSDIVSRPGVTYDYDPDLQLELLGDELKCGREEAARRIDDVVGRCGEFMYPGAVEFLKRLRERGIKLVLLTLGNPNWQKRKIRAAGIEGLFDAVLASGSPKSELIAGLAPAEGKLVVVNDNGDEIRQMREVAPKNHYIMKRGPKSASPDFDVPIADSFDEVEKLIYAQDS